MPKKDKKEKAPKKPPEVNPDLYDLAGQIIEKYPDRFGHISTDNFTVISVFGKGRQKFAGKCRAVKSPYTALLGDICYIIEINEDRLVALDAYKDPNLKSIKMLLYHELAHIHPDGCNPDEKGYRKVVKHDIEDFAECLKIAGNDGPFDWMDDGIPDILE